MAKFAAAKYKCFKVTKTNGGECKLLQVKKNIFLFFSKMVVQQ